MNIYSVCGFAIVAAIFSSIIKKKNPEFSLAITIITVLSLFLYAVEYINEIVYSLEALESFDSSYINIPLKILGLTVFAKIAQSICEDTGEKAVANTIGILSKIFSIIIALPLFKDFLEQVKAVMTI